MLKDLLNSPRVDVLAQSSRIKRVRKAVTSEIMAQLPLEKLVTAGTGTAVQMLGFAPRPRSREPTRCGSCAPQWARCGSSFLTSTRWCSMTCIRRSRSCTWSHWLVSGPRGLCGGSALHLAPLREHVEGGLSAASRLRPSVAVSLCKRQFGEHHGDFAWELTLALLFI